MAKPIELSGGSKGKKNSNARSAAAQRPHKSTPVKTQAAAVRPYKGKAEGHGSNGMKAITKPSMPHKVGKALGHAREWMNRHGLDTGTVSAITAAESAVRQQAADKVGATKTSKSSKKTTSVAKVSGPKIQKTSRAFKTVKKRTSVVKVS